MTADVARRQDVTRASMGVDSGHSDRQTRSICCRRSIRVANEVEWMDRTRHG